MMNHSGTDRDLLFAAPLSEPGRFFQYVVWNQSWQRAVHGVDALQAAGVRREGMNILWHE